MKRFALALFAITPMLAHAQPEMPYYDPKLVCDHLNNFGGHPSQMIFEQCMTNEQEGYDDVKGKLQTVSQDSLRACRRMTEFGGFPSYAMLDECLKQESRSQKNNSSFQFKR